MKKFFNIAVLTVLMTVLMSMNAFAADESIKLTASNVEVSPEEVFDIELSVPVINELSYCSMFKICFDNNAFEVTNISTSEIKDAEMICTDVSEANTAGSVSYCYMGIDGENTIDLSEGFDMNITFRVKDTARPGNYSIFADREDTFVKHVLQDGYTEKECLDVSNAKNLTIKVLNGEGSQDEEPAADNNEEQQSEPETGNNSFSDVPEKSYYSEAVNWAVSNGITKGLTESLFGPDELCDRAQVVTFLWRANGSPEATGIINPFTDVKESDYYYNAVLWAAEKGITTGTSDTTFSPSEKVSRAQVVTFLWRNNNMPESEIVNPFTDISSDDYYYKAVLWAVEKGITTGISDGIFAPDNFCSRAQIVTFLYRSR